MSDTTYFKGVNGKTYTIPPIKELCTILETKFKTQEDEIEYWKTKYTNAISGYTEYQKLKKQKEDIEKCLHNGFGIYESEKEAIVEWLKEHKKSHMTATISYKFIPSSLGTIGQVECSCGKCFEFRELA